MKNTNQASDVSDALLALKQIVSEDASPSYIQNDNAVREKFVLDPALRVQAGTRRSEKAEGLSFEAKLARLETLLGQDVEDEFEDENLEDALAPMTDVPLAEPVSRLSGNNSETLVEVVKSEPVSEEQSPDEVPVDHAPLTSDAATLDKEQMRDMVSELIREELSGLFGEKITANIRKMVQREVTIAKLSTTE